MSRARPARRGVDRAAQPLLGVGAALVGAQRRLDDARPGRRRPAPGPPAAGRRRLAGSRSSAAAQDAGRGRGRERPAGSVRQAHRRTWSSGRRPRPRAAPGRAQRDVASAPRGPDRCPRRSLRSQGGAGHGPARRRRTSTVSSAWPPAPGARRRAPPRWKQWSPTSTCTVPCDGSRRRTGPASPEASQPASDRSSRRARPTRSYGGPAGGRPRGRAPARPGCAGRPRAARASTYSTKNAPRTRTRPRHAPAGGRRRTGVGGATSVSARHGSGAPSTGHRRAGAEPRPGGQPVRGCPPAVLDQRQVLRTCRAGRSTLPSGGSPATAARSSPSSRAGSRRQQLLQVRRAAAHRIDVQRRRRRWRRGSRHRSGAPGGGREERVEPGRRRARAGSGAAR